MQLSDYLANIPAERHAAIQQLTSLFTENLPAGFAKQIAANGIHFVVPHSSYPAGYHCDPKQPLPFITLHNQKKFIAIYHMGLYAWPELTNWFTEEYTQKSPTKLDMGKSCIRLKKWNQIPYEVFATLATKITPQQWIERYEAVLKK